MTGEEFEAQIAQRCGLTVGQFHARGRYPEPCHCGEDYCEGWQLGHQREDAILENELRDMGGHIWW